MMIQPDVQKLIDRAGTRYALVVATAKRARQLVDGEIPTVQLDKLASDKPVTVAVQEIFEDKVILHPTDKAD